MHPEMEYVVEIKPVWSRPVVRFPLCDISP